MNFKTWVEKRKVKDADLAFTKALFGPQHLDAFSKVAERMAAFQPTFSDGLAFLEQVTDLLLLGHEDLFAKSETTFQNWQNQIKDLRYPQTKLRDEQTKAKFENYSWPAGAKVKFERRGDKSGVEFRVFISSPSDLKKTLASLERVQAEMLK